MSPRKTFAFKIDALSPETLTMKSLALYLSDLSDLFGSEKHVHFDCVKAGSAELKWWPDEHVEFEVRQRLNAVDDFQRHQDTQEAILRLNKRLANDNCSAVMLDPDRKVIAKFPGSAFRWFKDVPAFWQEDRLQGRLIRIGGKDNSIHANIDMGGRVVSNITMREDLARDIVKYFLGPTLALHGKARWQRDYLGQWKLLNFLVHSFDVMDDSDLLSVVESVESYLSEGIGSDSDPFHVQDKEY